jgi:hypothetical protein
MGGCSQLVPQTYPLPMNDSWSAWTASLTPFEWALRASRTLFSTLFECAVRSSYLLVALSKSATMLSFSDTWGAAFSASEPGSIT